MKHAKDYCTKKMFVVLGLLLLAPSIRISAANEKNEKHEFSDCNNELKLAQLSVKTLRAKCQEVDTLKARKFHTDNACITHLSVEDDARVDSLDAQTICAHSISAGHADSDQVCANHLNVWKDACVGSLDAQSVCTNLVSSEAINSDIICTQDLNVVNKACVTDLVAQTACVTEFSANDACVNNLVVGSLLNCGKYRATMTFAANQTYTLGDIIDWNTILDDPNGNISFIPNSHYTAPYSGYYAIMLQLDQDDIQGNDPILGTPVANLEILVNGVLFRQTFVPFLAFHNEQKATVSGLLSLTAGDQITSRYKVLVMQDGVGLADYVGTVNILGTGTEENGSVFKIHLLSIDCPNTTPCTPCTTGESGTNGCPPCPELCTPCQSSPCNICTPINPDPCSCTCCPTACCIPCVTGI